MAKIATAFLVGRVGVSPRASTTINPNLNYEKAQIFLAPPLARTSRLAHQYTNKHLT